MASFTTRQWYRERRYVTAALDRLWERVQDLPVHGIASPEFMRALDELTEQVDQLTDQSWVLEEVTHR